jgi:hypothetical protein
MADATNPYKTIHPTVAMAVRRFPAFHHELDIPHRLNVLGGINFHGDDVSQDASAHVLLSTPTVVISNIVYRQSTHLFASETDGTCKNAPF